jgi:hypothetical protein
MSRGLPDMVASSGGRSAVAWAICLWATFLSVRVEPGLGEDRLFVAPVAVLAVGWAASGLTGRRVLGVLVLAVLTDVLGGGVLGAWTFISLLTLAVLSLIDRVGRGAGAIGRAVLCGAGAVVFCVMIIGVRALTASGPVVAWSDLFNFLALLAVVAASAPLLVVAPEGRTT